MRKETPKLINNYQNFKGLPLHRRILLVAYTTLVPHTWTHLALVGHPGNI